MPVKPPVPSDAPRQRRKQERPQELLDAALAVFVEKGFAATRIDDVAHRAGVSKGTLYLYYASKEELLKAVISQHLSARIAAVAAQAQAYTGSSAQALQTLLADWWQRVFDDPVSGVFKLIVTEVRNFPEIVEFYVREVVQPGQQLIGSFITRAIEAGEFRRVDVASTVQSILLPMVMMCVHKHSIGACLSAPPPTEPSRFIHDHIDLLLHGLLAGKQPDANADNVRAMDQGGTA